ncbi:Imm50 family immunity protein [Streptomyces sp. NPDC058964]|uniref:Imm50 family immunity protein n=1 Tax=Streptomyces sp. NPDC058964 TaxID=3346681 RepID=UPI00369DD028
MARFLVNPEVLRDLYGHVPDLKGVRFRSVNLNWRGPTVTLRVDLPYFPASPPAEWADAGTDTVQCQFEFGAVEGVSLEEWTPPASGDVEMVPPGAERCMRVTVRGPGVALRFVCNESVVVRHVSAFGIAGDGADGGPHLFVSKADARLHSSVPGTDVRVFHGR